MTTDPNLVVYHGSCIDGYTAAWAIWRNLKDACEYRAAAYGQPTIPLADFVDRDVMFVDFSYKLPDMMMICAVAKSVQILDHHISAFKNLAPLIHAAPANFAALFDMDKSGARLAYEWANPGASYISKLVRIVESHDLWRFNVEHTKSLFAYAASMPFEFEAWDQMAVDMEAHADCEKMIFAGEAINRAHDKECDSLLRKARKMVIGGYVVPVVNAPYWHSSVVGNRLALLPDAPFGATYYDAEDGRRFSLRSVDSKVDVSEVAVSQGGGGHRNASGFEKPIGWEGDHVCTTRQASKEVWKAAQALLDDVHARYPGEELRCPLMQELERAVGDSANE